MGPFEHAQLLLRKAAHDEYAVNRLGEDPDAPDELIGFHAQQAVEKALKAVLAARAVRYRWTHDLVELVDLLRENGIRLPERFEDIFDLNPFAAEFRYDEMPQRPEEPFDRAAVRELVAGVRAWAEGVIGDAQEG